MSARRSSPRGFSLVELLLVITIGALLAALAVPRYFAAVQRAKVIKAVAGIKTLASELEAYRSRTGKYPSSLAQIGRGRTVDPWGRFYEYLNFETLRQEQSKSKRKGGLYSLARKNKNLVPINTDYDLYSRGADGGTVPPLTAASSHDDIVRANDGAFIGLASDY